MAKQVQVSVLVTVLDECPGDTCTGKAEDHNPVTVDADGGFGGVPLAGVPEAIARSVADVGAQALAKLMAGHPELEAARPDGPPEAEAADGAPSAEELTKLFGDPSRPRNFEELAEAMARGGGIGIVNVAELEELQPLKEALRRAFEKDPDRA